MTPIFVLCLILTVGYGLLMALYARGWQRQPGFVVPAPYTPRTFITIIIPARNEEANIGNCIDAILAQKYPADLLEIIVVDDHSDDNTAAIVAAYNQLHIRCLSLAHELASKNINSYKKAALAAGIAASKGELIITTDADCTAPNTWLLHIAAKYELENPVMIVAPVAFSANNSLVQIFQAIDFTGMQGITAAAHAMKMGNMSNGANLAFTKAAYLQVNGYDGIDKLASGDDYLLMMKMNKAFPGRIAYLRASPAIVRTLPQPTWRSFLQQRIRWASKSGKYNDGKLTAILILVYLFNCLLLYAAVMALFDIHWVLAAALMCSVKVAAELIFLVPAFRFFRKEWLLRYFVVLQPLHIIYIVIAGLLGFAGGYKWKGRSVK
ncbi:MAG: glycosyltransferase [Bacteroidota bacterium]